MLLISLDGMPSFSSDSEDDVRDYLLETYGIAETASTTFDRNFLCVSSQDNICHTVRVTTVPALFRWIPCRGGKYRYEYRNGMMDCHFRPQHGIDQFLRIRLGMDLCVMGSKIGTVNFIEPQGWVTFSGRFHISQVLKWNMVGFK